MVEKVLSTARLKGIDDLWKDLQLGNPTKRVTSYSPRERIMAVLAGLACGMKGIASGNTVLRTNSAVVELCGGRFADQGTIHRWLGGVTPQQAIELRKHLRQVARHHGEFWKELRSERRLILDIDGQGVIARGRGHEEAQWGYLGNGVDRGYQRYVIYSGKTREVLDESIRPGNTNLMGELPALLAGLDDIFVDPQWREQVVIRLDAHGGTAGNLHAMQTAGYHYLTRMQCYAGVKRLKKKVVGTPGETFEAPDSTGRVHRVEYWDVPAWTFRGRRGHAVTTRAILLHELNPDGQDFWWVLLTDLTEAVAKLWDEYHQRGGTIEEYNDQSEEAYHLKGIRTGNIHGLGALYALVGLCWNLTAWATEDLELPPKIAPHADPYRWVPARDMSLAEILERASHCGLILNRQPHARQLEVEDTIQTKESRRWMVWLNQPIQQRFSLAA